MIEVTADNYQKQLKITRHIDTKLSWIWQKTSVSSNLQNIVSQPEFKDLVKMGPKIVPYLIHKGVSSGFSWTILLLLGTITGEDPVSDEHEGRFYEQVNDWMTWFLKSKYNNHDIYFGLLDDTP